MTSATVATDDKPCTPTGSCVRRTTKSRPVRCSRPVCIDAKRRYEKRLALRIERGERAHVPAGPIATRVRELQQRWKQNTIAAAAGIPKQTMRGVGNPAGPIYATVHRSIAARIMRLTADDLGPPEWVSAVGAIRRIQALCAIGWSLREQSIRGNFDAQHIISRGPGRRVTAETYDRIVTLYERLSMTPGPSDIAREHAKANRWAPPLAWDDEALDLPDAEPTGVQVGRAAKGYDEAAVDRAVAGELEGSALTPPERVDAVRRLNAEGLSDTKVAARLGITPRTVLRIRERAGIAASASQTNSGSGFRHLYRAEARKGRREVAA